MLTAMGCSCTWTAAVSHLITVSGSSIVPVVVDTERCQGIWRHEQLRQLFNSLQTNKLELSWSRVIYPSRRARLLHSL